MDKIELCGSSMLERLERISFSNRFVIVLRISSVWYRNYFQVDVKWVIRIGNGVTTRRLRCYEVESWVFCIKSVNTVGNCL